MKIKRECESCETLIKLEYDEANSTPEYCPFCGEEIDGVDGDYEMPNALTPDVEWDD